MIARTVAPLLDLLRKQGALVTLAILFVLASVRYDSFLTAENLVNVLRQNAVAGLVALGMTLVILGGGIDLSVGSQLAAGGVVSASLSDHGPVIALAAGVLTTTAIGLVNGILVSRAAIPPFIATLVTGLAVRGVLLAATNQQSVRLVEGADGLKWLGRGWMGPLPVLVAVLLLAYALATWMLNHTRAGRHLYAMGDNAEAARLLGLNVGRLELGVYALCGGLSGFAGALLAARLGVAQPVAGNGIELTVITAVVLGGTSLGGGQGGAPGTLVGLLLLAVIFNAFNLEGALSSYWQWVLRGILLLFVVILPKLLGGWLPQSRKLA